MSLFRRNRPDEAPEKAPDGSTAAAGGRMVDEESAWITRPLGLVDLGGGLPAPWMQDGVRILHGMWENPEANFAVSYAENHAAALERGDPAPHLFGRPTGLSLVMEEPPPGWRRLRWAEAATRLEVELDPRQGLLESQLRPLTDRGSWPTSILPPPMGTLDKESFLALARVLDANTTGPTVAYNMRDESFQFGGVLRLGMVEEIVALSIDRRYTPNNWWPQDRAWLVWTNADLSTSAVFGNTQLIKDVAAIPGLETLPYQDVWWPEASVLNRSLGSTT